MWDSPDWIAEEKYDGDRRIAQFCGKVVRFTGRRKSVKDGLYVEKTESVPHLSGKGVMRLIDVVRIKALPPASLEGTVLDGEMICPAHGTFGGKIIADMEKRGGESKFVTSIMGSLPEEAVRKQIERGWLRYVIFDCLFYKGKDVRHLQWTARHGFMRKAVEEWGNPYASAAPFESHAHSRDLYDNVVKRCGEGVILKNVNHKYGDKQGWVKVKREATADVVIMGFIDAKMFSKKVSGETSMTKYAKAGLIGAVQCGQYTSKNRIAVLVEVATVSGIDDLLREEMTKSPKRFIGRVIEIKFNAKEPSGRFRHPRYTRFRDDKCATDCVWRRDEQ